MNSDRLSMLHEQRWGRDGNGIDYAAMTFDEAIPHDPSLDWTANEYELSTTPEGRHLWIIATSEQMVIDYADLAALLRAVDGVADCDDFQRVARVRRAVGE